MLTRTPLRRVVDNPELVVLVAVVAGSVLVPPLFTGRPVSLGQLVLGVPQGALLALQAVGMVLIYRTNRIINFGQAALGTVAGFLFYNLAGHRTFIALGGKVCGCLPDDPRYAPWGWQAFNYTASLVVAVAIGPLLGYLVYLLIIRRFRTSTRLVLTVATVGLSSVVVLASGLLFQRIFPHQPVDFSSPYDIQVTVSGTTLHLPDVLAVVAAVVGCLALAVFLRRTSMGVILRATSDNEARAQTLGVNASSVGAVAWTIAAALSSVAIVVTIAGNSQAVVGVQAEVVVTLLAILVIARMTNIVVAVVAALGLGVADRALSAQVDTSAVLQGLLLVIIATVLLFQRRLRQRSDSEGDAIWRGAVEARPIPAALRELPVVRRGIAFGIVVVAVALLGYPWISPAGNLQLATVAVIYAIIGLSILVLTGWAGQISLGQLAFAAIGAYVTAVLVGSAHVPMLVAILAGAIVGAVAAVVVGLPALRLPGLNLAAATLALALATTALLLNREYLGAALPTTLPRPGLFGLDLEDDRVFYYLSLVVLALVIGAVLGIRHSRMARTLIAVRDNEQAAQLFGISVVAARLRAFALSGFLAALAGGLLAFQQHGVQAPAFSADTSLRLFLVTVIGGLGSVWGPVIGQVTDRLVALSGVPLLAALWVGGGVILLLMLAPGGLSAIVYGMRDGILRRVALRHRIDVPSLLADGRQTGDRRRARVLPKLHRGGATVFVPVEYRLDDQWSIRTAARTGADS